MIMVKKLQVLIKKQSMLKIQSMMALLEAMKTLMGMTMVTMVTKAEIVFLHLLDDHREPPTNFLTSTITYC